MIITAPEPLVYSWIHKSIFLAGSIEMGKAEDWQKAAIKLLDVNDNVIFNPRRPDWDSSWTKDDPRFVEQVNWELNALDKAEFILMYLQPSTLSPITLLELGLYASSGKIHIICEDPFWRKGNVDIVCKRNDIPQYRTIEDACKTILLTD